MKTYYAKTVTDALLKGQLGKPIGDKPFDPSVPLVDGDGDGRCLEEAGAKWVPCPPALSRVLQSVKDLYNKQVAKKIRVNTERQKKIAEIKDPELIPKIKDIREGISKLRTLLKKPETMPEDRIKIQEAYNDVYKQAEKIFNQDLGEFMINGKRYRASTKLRAAGILEPGTKKQPNRDPSGRATHRTDLNVGAGIAISDGFRTDTETIRFSGDVVLEEVDSPNKRILAGMFVRSLEFKDMDDEGKTALPESMYHQVFTIEEEFQGVGLGQSFNIATEKNYGIMGIKESSLQTDWDGTYNWAKAGYKMTDTGDIDGLHDHIGEWLEGNKDDLVSDYGLDLVQTFERLHTDFGDGLVPIQFLTIFPWARDALRDSTGVSMKLKFPAYNPIQKKLLERFGYATK
jgi:hypothetical protein